MLARSYDTPIDINGESMTLNEAREKLNNGWNEYNQGLAEYETARTQLDEAESQLQAGRQRVEEGEQQLAEGRDKLEDAKSELESGRAEIDEKTEELEGAKASLAEMAPLTWSISPRAYNGSVMEVLALSDMTHRLSFSMAGLFVIVGMLVSYSAVSRIVHEQIMQIGTKKALGLRGREITLSFILYSTIAVAIGAIVGIVVGVFVVEGIIGTVMAKRFAMGAYPPYFGFPLAVEITLLELTLILGATWIACRSILKRHAVDLLRGEEPPMAKERFYEKWGVWAKLSLFTQTMVSNCVNDKRRVFSTVVGVAGCTALIVTAITLNDDVMESYDRHYRDVFQFDIIVELDPDDDDAAVDAQAAIDAQGLPSVQVRRFGCSVTNSDGSIAVMRVVAPLDAELFSRFYHVTSTAGGDADLGSQGIWVSRAYADHMGVKAGDEIELDVGDGREHKTTIAGFFEYNLTTFEVIIGPESYQDLFGSAPEANALLVDSEGRDFASINHAVGRTAGVKALVDDKHIQGKNFRDFASISRVVVLIYLVLAVLMAAVVLLNLNVMFIDEKKRELIVLMINGFSVHDAKRYIYNDTIVLTVIGIILGLILGGIMGTVTVWSIEPESGHFFKGISWLAMGVAVLGSGVLSIIMSLIALRRIPRFTLTDINRS